MKKFFKGVIIIAGFFLFSASSIYTTSGTLHTIGALVEGQRLQFGFNFNGAYEDFDTTYISLLDSSANDITDTYGFGGVQVGISYAFTRWLQLGVVTEGFLDGIDKPEAEGRPGGNGSIGSYGFGDTEVNLKLTTSRFFNKIENADVGIYGFYKFSTGAVYDSTTTSASVFTNRYIQNDGGLFRYFTSSNGDIGGRIILSYRTETKIPLTINLNGGYTMLAVLPDPMLMDYAASIAAKIGVFVPVLEVFGFRYSDISMYNGELINFASGGIRFEISSGFSFDIGADFRLNKFNSAFTPTENEVDATALYNDGWEGAPSWKIYAGATYFYDFKKKNTKPVIVEVKKTLITGKVVNAETGEPLKAMITLPGYSKDIMVMSDYTGLYSLEVIPGTVRVRADKQGFNYEEKGIVIEKGQTQIIDFAMNPTKIAKGEITGKVIDKSNDKLVNAKVSIPGTGITDFYPDGTTGIYKVILDPGTYTITAVAEGFLNYAVPVVVEEDKTLVMDIEMLKKGGKIVLKGIYFESGKATILPESYAILNTAVKLLKDHSKVKIEVQGHTDSVGSNADNQLLSQARADAVRTYLINNGIDKARMEAKGYGEVWPIATNDTKEGKAENRRIEFLILGE